MAIFIVVGLNRLFRAVLLLECPPCFVKMSQFICNPVITFGSKIINHSTTYEEKFRVTGTRCRSVFLLKSISKKEEPFKTLV